MKPYDPKILKQKAIDAIEKNKLLFVEDICAYIGISKPTFYDYFKVDTDDFNELKDLLEKNKIQVKVGIRKKWYERQSDTGLMALYKLCSTKEEHRLLQQNYTDHNPDDKAIAIQINVAKKEDIEDLNEWINKPD